MRSPYFQDTIDTMAAVHDSKNEDYADDGNPFSNFEGAAKTAGVSVDVVFQVMIGIKMERLRQLTSGKEANHESLMDTVLDLANYAAIWYAYKLSRGAEPAFAFDYPTHGLAEITL